VNPPTVSSPTCQHARSPCLIGVNKGCDDVNAHAARKLICVNVNINATYNQMTDEELRYELASLVNAVRAAKGQPLLELPGPKKDEAKH
jgi:hypothetical protein